MNRRFRSLIVGPWLAFVFLFMQGVDALGVHSCPLHDSAAGAGAGHGAHASHGSNADHSPGPGEKQHGPCTCVGTCSASSGAVSFPEPSISFEAYIQLVFAPSFEWAPSLRATRPAYFLPYSQAPPLVG